MSPISRSRIGSLTTGLVLLSFVLAARPTSAVRWQTLGPDDDGSVVSLAFSSSRPAFAYAGTYGGGVSRSTNGGRTWVAANTGLTNSFVTALAVHPTDERFVWAATQGGLFRSVDAGRIWRRVFPEHVTSVATDPENPSIVYLGTLNGMFRSGNGGQTWLAMGESLMSPRTPFQVLALVVAPSRPRTLYAAFLGAQSGIYMSENGGISWSRISRNVASCLAVDPRNPATLWANHDLGLQLTTDAGATWSQVLSEQVEVLAITADGARVFAGGQDRALMTRDQGAHWESIGGFTQHLEAIAVDPAHPFRLLVGSFYGGIYTLDWDHGTWRRTSSGLVGFTARSVEPAPDGSGLWVASGLGLYQTSDNGATWRRNLVGWPLEKVAIAPSDPATIYASAYAAEPALFCSHDGGVSWRFKPTGFSSVEPIESLAVHPRKPRTVYAGNRSGLFKSTNAGGTWGALPLTGRVAGLAIDAGAPEEIYATQGRRLFRSRDGGTTWRVLMDGAAPELKARFLRGVAVAPTEPRSLAVIDAEHVFVSYDGGRTWQARSPGLLADEHQTVTFAPGDEQTILVGGLDGAALSTDGGTTWQKLGEGISGVGVWQLRYDPNDPARLYAATSARAVMVLDPAP